MGREERALIFVQWLLCKYFTFINYFEPYNNHRSRYYSHLLNRNGILERSRSLPKTTHLVNTRSVVISCSLGAISSTFLIEISSCGPQQAIFYLYTDLLPL